jgi:xanthine/uracil permease
VLGLCPKLAALVEAVPSFVLGGAGLVMFGMVAATGVRILAKVDLAERGNLLVVAVSVSLGMIPLVAPKFFQHLPLALAPVLNSGILLTAVSAVLLNLYFNGLGGAADAGEGRAAAQT